MNKLTLRFGVIALLILLAAATRLVPHIFNFSPMGAMALFGAAHFSRRWQAFLVPIAAVWLSDLYLNNVLYPQYNPAGFTWLYEGFYWQYAAYALIVGLGLFLYKKVTIPTVLGGALGASLLFFLVSNFGVWFGSTMYPQNMGGLLACYVAGLPFLSATVMSDILFSTVLFGGFYLLELRMTELRTAN